MTRRYPLQAPKDGQPGIRRFGLRSLRQAAVSGIPFHATKMALILVFSLVFALPLFLERSSTAPCPPSSSFLRSSYPIDPIDPTNYQPRLLHNQPRLHPSNLGPNPLTGLIPRHSITRAFLIEEATIVKRVLKAKAVGGKK
jgi:hypothetical protein